MKKNFLSLKKNVPLALGSMLLLASLGFTSYNYPKANDDKKIGFAESDLKVDTVASGLTMPWATAFLPGGELLVTERGGKLRLVKNGVLDPTPISGVP